jgi:hypothetical protein
MRGMNLANELVKRGHRVTLISSDFDHFTKLHRRRHLQNNEVNEYLSIRLIPSRGYAKHVSIARLIDHAQLGIRLQKAIRNLEIPDVVFIGYPPIETAWVLSRTLKRRQIPFFLDVKDAWPDIFLTRFDGISRFIAKIILKPYFKIAKSVFENASALVAPTPQFLEWALKKASRNQQNLDCVVPLSSPPPSIVELEKEKAKLFWKDLNVDASKQIRLFFVGSLTDSFDFEPLISLAKNHDVQIVLAGKGPQLNRLLELSKQISNLVIPGWINESQLQELADISQFSVIPLINRFDFDMHVTNKFIDSLRLGKPILTSNKAMYENQIRLYGIGELYTSSNLHDVVKGILQKPHLLEEMVARTRQIYSEKFEFYGAYGRLISKLEEASKL